MHLREQYKQYMHTNVDLYTHGVTTVEGIIEAEENHIWSALTSRDVTSYFEGCQRQHTNL